MMCRRSAAIGCLYVLTFSAARAHTTLCLEALKQGRQRWEERAVRLAEQHEGKVRLSFDAELYDHMFARILPYYRWDLWLREQQKNPERWVTVWRNHMTQHPHGEAYRDFFQKKEAIFTWEPLGPDKTYTLEQLHEWACLSPEGRAALVPWDRYQHIRVREEHENAHFFLITVAELIRREGSDRALNNDTLLALKLDAGEAPDPFRVLDIKHDLTGAVTHLRSMEDFLRRMEQVNKLYLLEILRQRPHDPVLLGPTKTNTSYYPDILDQRGILRVYSDGLGLWHFELRNHFTDPLTEVEQTIDWVLLDDEAFLAKSRERAAELLSLEPKILERLKDYPQIIEDLRFLMQ